MDDSKREAYFKLKNSIKDCFTAENNIKDLLKENPTDPYVLQKLNLALEMNIDSRQRAQNILMIYKTKYPDRVLQWELEERKSAYGKDKNV